MVRSVGVATKTARLLLVAFACAVALGALPAHGLSESRVTLNQETGGQLTRFTLVTNSDDDALVPSVDIAFPEGFDLSAYRLRATLLDGIRRIPVEYTESVEGGVVRLGFEPSVPPGSQLRVEIYDVMTPEQGGDYRLGLSYTAETTQGPTPGVEQRTSSDVLFSFSTPLPGEKIGRWLDDQAWVEQFNDVKVLGIFFKPQVIAVAIPVLFAGWLISIALVVLAFPLAIGGGLALAFMRMSRVPPVRWIAGLYINVIRGTPLFLQIFIAFIGLRIAGVRAPDFLTGVFVLALNSSAYLAEIFRAGIQSIHRGQFEAASSLGMSYWQAMQFVVIPQTVKRVLPTMTSEFILLFKDTALLAAVGIFELMMRAQNLASRMGNNLTPFIVAAVYYLIVTIPLINWVQRLEERLAVSEHGQPPKAPKGRGGLFWRPTSSSEFAEFEASSEVHQSR